MNNEQLNDLLTILFNQIVQVRSEWTKKLKVILKKLSISLSEIGRYYIEDCMFGLFPTNKSDYRLRIPELLWPFTNNTELLELLTT